MFIDKDPSLSTYWRAIVLLGNNVASYKFALAKTLLEVQTDSTLIRMEDLALPFALNIAQHLEHNDKQVTSKSSKFLDYCRQYNSEQIAQDELRTQAIKLGFVNVIDAFHKVSGNEAPRFFEDKRKDEKGIILTDNFYKLLQSSQSSNFGYEVESRWRLWETAISLGISPSLIQVRVDNEGHDLFVHNPEARRISISSSRDALNGYQKGSCFYCSKDILIEQGYENSCDVDHFFPHKLKSSGIMNVDQVWNLVLACRECNRGEGGKFERIAHLDFLYALNDRNNYYVESHHPLRETIVNQTGRTEVDRKAFLQSMYNGAVEAIPSKEKWKPRLRKELSVMSKCPFCSIESERIVDESELFFVIRDGFPVTPLHTLVIPRRHVTDYFGLNDAELEDLQGLLRKHKDLIQSKDAEVTGCNIGMNCGEDAGQTIFHCHIHLIPRRKGDTKNPRGGVRGVIKEKQQY